MFTASDNIINTKPIHNIYINYYTLSLLQPWVQVLQVRFGKSIEHRKRKEKSAEIGTKEITHLRLNKMERHRTFLEFTKTSKRQETNLFYLFRHLLRKPHKMNSGFETIFVAVGGMDKNSLISYLLKVLANSRNVRCIPTTKDIMNMLLESLPWIRKNEI